MGDDLPRQPYLTVGTDSRGSTCWFVVTKDMRLSCSSGVRAVELLRAVCKSRGITTPSINHH